MNYVLGIDTTFHTTAVALVDDSGEVVLDERRCLDIEDEKADEFFNLHSENLHYLLGPVAKNFMDRISFIAVSNNGGAFHSLPVGVNAANVLAAIYGKKLVGISHEVAHLYSNWIGRRENEFRFPIVSLNISAAHSNIWFIGNQADVQKLKNLTWHNFQNKFSGLGAFFGYFCHHLGVETGRKEGGAVFSELASRGKIRTFQAFQKIKIRDNASSLFITNLDPIGNIIDTSRKYTYEEICDLAASLSDRLFTLLSEKIIDIAGSCSAREVHLAGGVAASPILREKMKIAADQKNFNFKAPEKIDYCFDNAVMVALAGYYQKKVLESQTVLEAHPDQGHYQYYFNKYFRSL